MSGNLSLESWHVLSRDKALGWSHMLAAARRCLQHRGQVRRDCRRLAIDGRRVEIGTEAGVELIV